MKILVSLPSNATGDSFLPPWVRAKANQLGEVVWNPSGDAPEESWMKRNLPGCDAVLSGWGTPRFTGELLSAAPRLAIIAHTGGSVGPIVSDAVYEKGIAVCSGNELYAESVAEGALAYMLAALRQIPRYDQLMHHGRWNKDTDTNRELFHKKIGVVGYGAITRHLLPLLRCFRTDILLFSSHMRPEEADGLGVSLATLPEIFETCDVISVHAAQRPENHHLINAALLRALKPGAVFINVSRGDLVDEEALASAAQTQDITVVLDVYKQEPLPAASPLRQLDNAILIPHMAGPTVDRRPWISAAMLDEIARHRVGKPLQYSVSAQQAARMSQVV